MTQKLRPYQIEIGRAVLNSVLASKGLPVSVEIARQGGKNELSAQLEVLLLTLFMGKGGYIVKCSPTFRPQTITSMLRLKERLDDAGYAGHWRSEQGYILRLGKAAVAFYSADGSAQVVGATAGIMLEVDEAQDVKLERYSKDFRPMASSTNATTVLYGTPWDDGTLLEQVKQTNLELEQKDGVRRHFRYDWREVAAHSPSYARFVEGERQRLGESHPLFQTQYCLNLVRDSGGLLSAEQRATLQGRHHRRRGPSSRDEIYVAGVDLAGELAANSGAKEALQDDALRRALPRKDSTVVTIARLDYSNASPVTGEPSVEIVEHYWWTGRPHHELLGQLARLLKDVWGCRRVVIDATGLGAGVSSFLLKVLGSATVTPFVFTTQSKSRLGFEFLAAVNSCRLSVYIGDGSVEWQEFWRQMERAKGVYRPNRTLNFFVEEHDGHDDFLMSAALAVEAASTYAPRTARGRS
ncbi:MAG: hypothetical protein EXR50_07560 [Dehalococcoidia bacterium]|nr:hypothetical protein [Dehalococcoidia bacterium]